MWYCSRKSIVYRIGDVKEKFNDMYYVMMRSESSIYEIRFIFINGYGDRSIFGIKEISYGDIFDERKALLFCLIILVFIMIKSYSTYWWGMIEHRFNKLNNKKIKTEQFPSKLAFI